MHWAPIAVFLTSIGTPPPSELSPANALLDQAADRARLYEAAALKWTCDEIVRHARYDRRGEASRESERRFELLMGADAEGEPHAELRAPLGSRTAASEHRLEAMRGFPPITSWLRLFHPDVRGWVSFQDRGEVEGPGNLRHAFAFRGARPYADAEDFREWEGTAWVDSVSGDLLAVEASPLSQADRMRSLVDRRNRRSVGVTIFRALRFRIGPKALGRRVEVLVGAMGDGFWLPHAARLETFEAEGPSRLLPSRVVAVSLEHCRKFEAAGTPGTARPIKPR